MAAIEVQYLDGQVEQQALSRSAPFSIGSHSSNSLRIEEEGVGVLHCRISWNGKAYEVMSGGSEGIDVNGNIVRHAALAEGDLLRVGNVDIIFRSNGGQSKAKSGTAAKEQPGESIGLKPVTEDEIPTYKPAAVPDEKPVKQDEGNRRAAARPPAEAKPPRRSKQKSKTPPPPDLMDVDDILEDGDDPAEPVKTSDAPLLKRGDWKKDDKSKPPAEETEQEAGASRTSIRDLKKRLAGRPMRPGERDAVRSPFVLGLVGGSVVLLLAALTVWFIIGRETAQKHYNAAKEQADQGNDKQAIDLYQGFIQEYPGHQLNEQARYELGQVQIRQALAGATPNWSRGLKEVEAFIKRHRDRPNYDSQIESLRKTASDIAFGAAKTVTASAKRPSVKPEALNQLLETSRQAGVVVGRLYPPDEQPARLNSRLADAHWQAEQAIATREAFLAAVASIEKSLEQKRPLEALAARKALLRDHSNFQGDRQIAKLLQSALELEQSLVQVDDDKQVARAAETAERDPSAPPPLSLVRHTRSGTGEDSVGRTVFAVAKDCCYGIDTVTGEPLWRRVIGLDTPFFPLEVETSVPGLLLFDTNQNELTLLERRSGKLVWRQPLGEPIGGEPLLHEGRAYVVTAAGRLYQIVLNDGQVTKRLTFSQPLISTPALTRNETQLVVAGRAAVLYTLSTRPLGCLAVTFSDHAAGSLEAPLLTMGSLLLMAENSNIDSGRLRVFDTRQDKAKLTEVFSAPIAGRVHQRPIIRGRQLFVTSTPERITAFSVSEEKEQKPLVRIAETRIAGEHSGPLFLKAGADGRLWMAGSAFRSFRLKTDAIAYDEGDRTADGISTQPLQLAEGHFFVGRRQAWHRAVLFTPVDRENLTSHWRSVFGSSVIAALPAGDALVCATETGDVYRLDPQAVKKGGFVMEATASLPVGDGVTTPLRGTPLNDELLAISSGGTQAKLWLLDRNGRIAREVPLPAPLEANPIALKAGVVLPLPGRLSIVVQSGSPPEDYPAPLQQESKPKWRHLVPLDEDEFLAVNDGGRVARIQFRTSPVAHLAEVNSVTAPEPLDAAPVAADGLLFTVDAGGRLTASDLSTLEPVSTENLGAPATNGPWFVGGRLYVEVGRQTLRSFAVADGKLTPGWSLPLEGGSLAGAPLVLGEQLVVALKNGEMISLNPVDGAVAARSTIRQPLASGPRLWGDALLLSTIDGSLHTIEPEMKQTAAGGAQE